MSNLVRSVVEKVRRALQTNIFNENESEIGIVVIWNDLSDGLIQPLKHEFDIQGVGCDFQWVEC